jgi:hypothetical protein
VYRFTVRMGYKTVLFMKVEITFVEINDSYEDGHLECDAV